ncbi:MAG: aminotransferase class IV [SAR324 cluster bacterium]|nr:aminotransferase class IV [SAR324 cluster bacterium]
MDVYYIDGQFVGDDKALISVKDIVVLRGFGVFDFLITYNKRPFRLKQHVERLQNSARDIGLEIKLSTDEICAITEETVKRNSHHDESNIRLVYTGGVAADGVTPEGNGYLMVMVTPKHHLPKGWYTEGVKVITVDIQRFMPTAKSTNYLTAVYALGLAKKQNAVEAIYIEKDKRLLEGTTTNFFMLKGDRLISPDKDTLPGVTQSVIRELAADLFEVEIRDIDKQELSDAEEVFLTASNKEVVPVITVDDLTIGNGKPGPKTLKIMQLFRDYTTAYGQGKV